MKEPRTILIDTREQRPLPLREVIAATGMHFEVQRGAMRTGDYALAGLEHDALVERKKSCDLVACCTCWRPHFEDVLHRMHTCTAVLVLLVEADLVDVLRHRYRSATTPASIIGSLSAWTLDYGARTWWAGSPEAGLAMLVRFFAAISRRVERGELPPAETLPATCGEKRELPKLTLP